jgi:serine/threonine protein kinase/tetratricopeptide (TPR) repeat protein
MSIPGPGAAAGLSAPAPMPASFAKGRYRTLRLLGEGGQKTAYLGRDIALDREVVISVLKTVDLDQTALERLRREARTMAQLGAHPNIVTVFDIADEEGQPCVITEFVEGGSISDLLKVGGEKPLPFRQTVQVSLEIAMALQYAHDSGVVHRDVKPANVWLTRDGIAKLGDFGLALAPKFSDLTVEGALVGSALYMAPEQALGNKAQTASDVYSLGAMLYEMATGRPPFRADHILGVLSQHVNTPPVAPSWHNADLPKALETLILEMLYKKPERRPETRVVVDRLRSLQLSTSAVMDIVVRQDEKSLSRLAEGILVGRENVIALLRHAADEARAGKGRLLLLSGEPGSGKTSLTEQLSLYAGIRNMKVLVGRCYEGEGAPAFWPWMQIMRTYSESFSAKDLLTAMGNTAATIADVVPEVREKLPNLAAPPRLEPDKARFRFFDSITTFLKSASARQPLVLVLDDLHWADEASVLLLDFLTRELGASNVLVVGTFRDLELGRHHPLTRMLGQFTGRGSEQRIALEGLTKADVAKYLELSSGVAPADALVSAIHQQTDGNPFFVAEIVRLLVAEGRLAEMGRAGGAITVPIPPSIREVLQRRLGGLSGECDRLLATASVMGRNFSLEVLCALDIESEDKVLDLLDEAIAARLIRELGGAGQYTFSHALIRDAVYEQMSATRRARLHHRIGQAIERVYAHGLDDYLSALSYHFTQSTQPGDSDKAIGYAIRAAERATRLLAYEEAVGHYEHALQLLGPGGEQPERLCQLLLALGEAQSRAGILDSARATLERVAGLARQLGRHEDLARAVLGIAPGTIGVMYGKADPVLVGLIEEALRCCEPSDSVTRAQLLARYSIANYHAPKARRLILSQEAVDMARRLNDPVALLPALHSHAIALLGFEQVEERLAASTELVQVAERAHAKEMVLRGYYGQFRESLGLGLRPQLDEAIEAYGRVADELRQPSHQWLYPFGLAVVAMMEGRFDECESLAMKAGAMGRRARDLNSTLFLTTFMVTLRGIQGRSAELVDRVRAAVEEYPFIPSWHSTLAKIYAELDRLDEARAEMVKVGDFAEYPRDGAYVVGMALQGQVAARIGDRERARLTYERLLPFARHNIILGASGVFYGPVPRYLGQLAEVFGEYALAEEHFEEGIAMARSVNSPPFLAYCQLEYGAMLLRRSQGLEARGIRLVEQGLALARSLGMQHAAQEGERVLKSFEDP